MTPSGPVPSRSPLLYASIRGYANIVDLILVSRPELNASCPEFKDAFYGACEFCNLQIVEILLQHDTHPKKLSLSDGYALVAASNTGNERIVELLVRDGANVNARAPWASCA